MRDSILFTIFIPVKVRTMKIKLLLTCCLVSFMVMAYGQQHRFIYLQTENQQTFYVKLNNLVYSSSPSGYLIIPKLIDGTYELEIGFPRNDYPSQLVSCVLAGKDEGFLLKNLGNETWGLFNLRTLQLAKAKPGKIGEAKAVASNDNSFEGTLSNVVETDLKKKKRKGDREPEVAKVKHITLLMDNADSKGLNRQYIVQNEESVDTVSILFEGNYISVKEEQVVEEFKEEKTVKDKPVVKFIEDEPKKTEMVNSNCKKVANENDFLKLRKNMAAKSKEADMISVAKSAFKKQCYTSDQIRSLGVLLMSDASKYEFLDAAYPFASDSEKFSSLRSLLTDTYYLNRFDALIRK